MSQRYAGKKEVESLRKGLNNANLEIEYINIQLDHIKKTADKKNKKRRFLRDFHLPSEAFWNALLNVLLCFFITAFSIILIAILVKTQL